MLSALHRHAQAFLMALQFLTTLPTPKNLVGGDELQGLSLLWYPAVGLLLGLLVTLLCSALPVPFYLQALLAVTLWIALTGGLHLDGLADCADAWAGGLGDREKTLLLLKDPRCGSMGVIALVMVILLKTLALAAIIEQQQLLWLWAVPVLGRLSLLLLFLNTPYIRPQGLGALLAQHFSRAAAVRVLLFCAIVALGILPFDVWCAFTMLSVAICLLMRWAAMCRLGGFTGDIAGAQVELVEVGLLLTLACRGVA